MSVSLWRGDECEEGAHHDAARGLAWMTQHRATHSHLDVSTRQPEQTRWECIPGLFRRDIDPFCVKKIKKNSKTSIVLILFPLPPKSGW